MIAGNVATDWPLEVIRFVSANLISFDPGEGWDHTHASAYEMGCDVLVALDYADPTERGAIARADPRVPDVLPRWDDICVAVLGLAEQQGRLAYRLPGGGLPPPRTYRVVAQPAAAIPEPNIAATNGLGPAEADPETLSVLVALGLVVDDKWTPEAETILWRRNPGEWGLTFESDPRFADAIEQAVVSIPQDIEAEMDRCVRITDADVAAAVAWSIKDRDEMHTKYAGTKAIISPPWTHERARRHLEFRRAGELDWVFFRRWRLPDGWLRPEEAKQALEIFHDSLAIQARQSVITRLYPTLAV